MTDNLINSYSVCVSELWFLFDQLTVDDHAAKVLYSLGWFLVSDVDMADWLEVHE